MTGLSRELIVAVKARADAATEGPWWQEGRDIFSERIPSATSHDIATHVWSDEDAEFIASARADVPVMADALLRVLDLHQARGDLARSCIHCSGEESGWVSWPCATVRAVTGDGSSSDTERSEQ